MKLLFLGFCGIISDYDKIMHVDFARVKEYYTLLKIHYGTVDYYEVTKSGTVIGENGETSLSSLVDWYDAIFIYHEATIERLQSKYHQMELYRLFKKRKVFIQLDCSIWPFTMNKWFMSMFTAVGIAHPYSFNQISHSAKYLIRNATIRRPSHVTSDPNNDIVYVGRTRKHVENLITFADRVQKTINVYSFAEDNDLIDRLQSCKFIIHRGSVKYNELSTALENASYGLCFFDNESPCGKILDYISYGLPVLADSRIGEADMILDDGLGQLFDINDSAYVPTNFDNSKIFDTVQHKHLWQNRVDQWISIIDSK